MNLLLMLGGFWAVRDVAADTTFIAESNKQVLAEHMLSLESVPPKEQGFWPASCTVKDASSQDRAVTLAYCIPLDARGWTWWDDPQHSRIIEDDDVYYNPVDNTGIYEGRGCGVTGTSSRYPMAVLTNGKRTICLAVPLAPPRLVRLAYYPAEQQLRAEFDFGLSTIPEHFPSCADAAVMAFEAPAEQAFRQALAIYHTCYPDVFERHSPRMGIWLPFADLAPIEHPEDFGFGFHELGAVELAAEDKNHRVGSYLYTEPQSHWQTNYKYEGRAQYADALAQIKEDAEKGDVYAWAVLTSGCHIENGEYQIYLEPIAWTKAVPFGLNPAPNIPTTDYPGWPNRAQCEMKRLSEALGWLDKPPAGLDGIYVDSIEGWSEIHNYRKEHWRVTEYPLTFSPDTKKVCLLNLWGTYAFVKALSEQLHDKGLTLMANDMFFRYWFYAPFVDFPGREFSWFKGEAFTPLAEERFLFLRAMSGRKPYLMLMNDNFENGGHMEQYFQRCLFYGVFPSMFYAHDGVSAAYWTTPRFYDRDRELFKKYIPLVKHVAEAGWEPLTMAHAEPEDVRVERYGKTVQTGLYFTVHNPDDSAREVRLALDKKALGLSRKAVFTELMSGLPIKKSLNRITLSLPANGYAVVVVE